MGFWNLFKGKGQSSGQTGGTGSGNARSGGKPVSKVQSKISSVNSKTQVKKTASTVSTSSTSSTSKSPAKVVRPAPVKTQPVRGVSKIRKTKSVDSLNNASPTKLKEHFSSRLTSLNGPLVGEIVYDVCAYVIHCPIHQKIVVAQEVKSKYIWLPFVHLPPTRTWSEGAYDGANIVLSNGDARLFKNLMAKPAFDKFSCMQIFRLQLPQTQKFNIRLIYYIRVTNKNPAFKCCKNTGRLQWLSVSEINNSKIKTNLWGPEVSEFSALIGAKKLSPKINEISLDKAFMYVPRDPPRNLEEEMLKSTNYSEKDIERLYTDYTEHCFPAFAMTLTSFSDYMSKYGFEKMDKKLDLLFRAFNYQKTGYLDFHEFLLGLTSIDPMAQNGQSRIKFIFKYFDLDADGYLNKKEFTSMVSEIYPQEKGAAIEKKVIESMKAIGVRKKGVFFEDFNKAVGAHKFRGTHGLCRSNRAIVQQISRSMANRTLTKATTKQTFETEMFKRVKYDGVCGSCRDKKYSYAIHTMRLDIRGHWISSTKLPEIDSIDTSSSGKEKSNSNKMCSVLGLTNNKFSIDVVWNQKSMANYFMKKIREFNQTKGTHRDKKGLLYVKGEREAFVKQLGEFCAQMEKIVSQDDRCAKATSPAFIIGDIHGNLEDLMTLERVLWNNFPLVSANFVFLGDYVDRGQWGLECALYIMCMKMLAPGKVVILRGNHEVRELQRHYTYYKECVRKYGDTLGKNAYEMTNRVFDKLPFSAVIDDAIYCAHGGIPRDTRMIDDINKQKNDLRNPETESSIAWQILWSDPCNQLQFNESAELQGIKPETTKGFIPNQKRGTAFLFAEDAINNFLQNNGLTHVVRAHEVPAKGFRFDFGSKCTTIFSCSHYCGNNNEAAVVHVDNEKLRIIRLDTVNNAPASD